MSSKHSLVLLGAQILIFIAALFFGFRLFAPRADERLVDLPAITFNVARAALADASPRGSFSNTSVPLRGMPMLPVGVGVEVRPIDSAHAVVETRYRRVRCSLRVQIGDSVPGRPTCR